MAITTEVDRTLRVLPDGTTEVKEVTYYLTDGVRTGASRPHRFVVSIEDENPDLSGLDAASSAVITAARTQERRDAAAARKAAREAEQA